VRLLIRHEAPEADQAFATMSIAQPRLGTQSPLWSALPAGSPWFHADAMVAAVLAIVRRDLVAMANWARRRRWSGSKTRRCQ